MTGIHCYGYFTDDEVFIDSCYEDEYGNGEVHKTLQDFKEYQKEVIEKEIYRYQKALVALAELELKDIRDYTKEYL